MTKRQSITGIIFFIAIFSCMIFSCGNSGDDDASKPAPNDDDQANDDQDDDDDDDATTTTSTIASTTTSTTEVSTTVSSSTTVNSTTTTTTSYWPPTTTDEFGFYPDPVCGATEFFISKSRAEIRGNTARTWLPIRTTRFILSPTRAA
jgi:hypothetical protein